MHLDAYRFISLLTLRPPLISVIRFMQRSELSFDLQIPMT